MSESIEPTEIDELRCSTPIRSKMEVEKEIMDSVKQAIDMLKNCPDANARVTGA